MAVAAPSSDSRDSLDRFLDLEARAREGSLSETGRGEWRQLVRRLLEGELGARARRDPTDGRRHLRSGVRLLAEVRLSPDRRATVSATLGEGGLKLHAALALDIGSVIEVALALPARPQPLMVRARVVWQRVGASGVAFVDLPTPDRELLESAVVEAMLRSR